MTVIDPHHPHPPEPAPGPVPLFGTVSVDVDVDIDDRVRRVVVVDDHELLRAGTRRILDDASGFTVVGEADDGANDGL